MISLYLFFSRIILEIEGNLKTGFKTGYKLVLPDKLDWPDDGQRVIKWVELQAHSNQTHRYDQEITSVQVT